MEEKKKRWRPTVKAFRALERENAMLKERLRASEGSRCYFYRKYSELRKRGLLARIFNL